MISGFDVAYYNLPHAHTEESQPFEPLGSWYIFYIQTSVFIYALGVPPVPVRSYRALQVGFGSSFCERARPVGLRASLWLGKTIVSPTM